MTKGDVTDYCLTFPGVYEDYPFHDITDPSRWTAVRHKVNRKCFAFIYERNDKLCINLKNDPFEADFLRQAYTDLTPAYHMNKEHWSTVTPGGDVPDEILEDLIQKSYDLTKPKKARKRK